MADRMKQTINTVKRVQIREKSIQEAKDVVKSWGVRHGDPEPTIGIGFWRKLVDRIELHYLSYQPELRTVGVSNLCYQYPYAEE